MSSNLADGQLLSRRAAVPRHLADYTASELADAVANLGEPRFRAQQAARHYYSHLRADLIGSSDMSPPTAAHLTESLLPQLLTPVKVLHADGGDTVKTAWRLTGGAVVESVLMRYPDRVTVCVSSQAGCGMGCPFCATGQAGLTRNLTTAEIVEQVRQAAVQTAQWGERLTNIVFMGMGEPLANFEALLRAIRRFVDPAPHAQGPFGMGMSARGITVSTVGLVPSIGRLAQQGLPLRLAVSLHAPDDELRNTLVPVNQRWPVAEVLAAAWSYAETTKRRVSIEYALIRDMNDQSIRAHLLGELLKGRPVHVNLIPLNPTPGSKWTASRPEVEAEFARIVADYGIAVTVRDTRGRDIDGACGQLAGAQQSAEGGSE